MGLLAADRAEIIELDVGSDEAVAACGSALAMLGWEISDRTEGHLSAYEDPAMLRCRTTPSLLEILLTPWSAHRTAVTVSVSAPGIGPAPARRAQRQVDALARRIQSAAHARS